MSDERRNWQLKGQGAANLVFAYCGDDPHLRGHVLRVRKTSAQTGMAVDRAVWEGVLHTADGCDIKYELEYMTYIMAPLLGRQYVFPGVPVPVPEELREAVGADTAGATSLPALVQPDHTTFHSKVAPGYTPVGPAICLEIKPKWGLDPLEVHRRQQSYRDLATPTAAAATESPHAAVGPTPPAAANGRSGVGPHDTDLDGAVPHTNVVDELQAEIRRRYPRFMLHMLYKHVKKGLPVSLYNPLDLFSGKKERMEAALWALIQCPSNNLSVFKDGAKIFGGNAKYAEMEEGKGAVLSSAAVGQVTGNKTADLGPLERFASELEDFVGAPQEVRLGRPIAPHAGAEPAAAASTPAAGGSCTAAEQPQQPPPPLSEGPQTSDPHAHQRAEQNKQQQSLQRGCSDSREALGTLVRLAALALQQEAGLLERLRHVQALDDLGAERAVQVYEQLLYELELESGCNGGVHTRVSGRVSASATAVTAGAGGDAGADADTIRRRTAADLACGLVRAASGEQQEAAPPHDRAVALRRYLLSATAKDCGVMVTLQRAVPAEAPPEAVVTPPPPPPPEAAAANSAPAAEPATATAAVRPAHDPWVGLLTDPVTGVQYMYKVAFVDLDVKAAAKIPHHSKMERSLLQCAAENLAVLEDMARRAGWPAPALTPTQQ